MGCRASGWPPHRIYEQCWKRRDSRQNRSLGYGEFSADRQVNEVTLIRIFLTLIAIPLGLDLYMPVPEDNPITQQKIELGRRLFNDRRLSRDGSIPCAFCH